VSLANGDTVTGLVENSDVTIHAGPRSDRLAIERIAQLSLRDASGASTPGAFRALMRNGDSLLVAGTFGPAPPPRSATVRTRSRRGQIDRVDFAESGERADDRARETATSVTGELAGEPHRARARGRREARRPSDDDPTLVRAATPAHTGKRGALTMTRPLAALALWSTVGCAGVHPMHPNFYSVNGDIRLGQQLQKEVEAEVTFLRLSALTAARGTRPGRGSATRARCPPSGSSPYSFTVVDSPEVNASRCRRPGST
jgi:hypothetical protein